MLSERAEYLLRAGKRISLLTSGVRQVHTTFPDGLALIEEFCPRTDKLLSRKSRKPQKLGEAKWNIEVGFPDEAGSSVIFRNTDGTPEMMANSSPICVRIDTPSSYNWRIRNLFLEKDSIMVSVESDKACIKIRTTTKKYYKELFVTDLQRLRCPLKENALKFDFKNHTLAIYYEKPDEALHLEKMIMDDVKKSTVNK